MPMYREIVEKIFEASTLEEAIIWRQAMVRRLGQVLVPGAELSTDQRNLYWQAKAETEMAISRLELTLTKGERWDWGNIVESMRPGD